MISAIFIQNVTRGAGSERAAVMLANFLSASGIEVHIISICGENGLFYDINPKVTTHFLFNETEIDNRRRFPFVLAKLAITLSKIRPDVIIDVFSSLSIYTLLLRGYFGYKVITWEHYGHEYEPGMISLGRKLALSFSNSLVVLTESERQYFARLASKRCKVTCIPNPTPFPNAKRSDVSGNQPIVLAVGRLTAVKRLDRAIRTWSVIGDNHSDWQLWIVGDGELKGDLEALSRSLDCKGIHFLGSQKHIEDIYSSARMILVTSESECLPMVIVEAMSFGIPVVTVDYGKGVYDLIEDHVNGFIVREQSDNAIVREMSKHIIALMEDEKLMTSISDSAYESSKEYRLDNVGRQWISLLEELNIDSGSQS